MQRTEGIRQRQSEIESRNLREGGREGGMDGLL